MAACIIRTAVAADLDALGDVFRRSSLSNDGDRPALLANPEVLEFAGDGVVEGRTRVATVDARIVGFSTIVAVGTVVDVEDLFVDPEWMRQGIGLDLMRDVVAQARQRNADYVEVTANPHALAFYARAGFVRCGSSDTRFGPADRLRIDLRQ